MNKLRLSQYFLLTTAIVLSALNMVILLTSEDKSDNLLLNQKPEGGTTSKENTGTPISLVYAKGLENLNSKMDYLEERINEIDKEKSKTTKKEAKEIGNTSENQNLISVPDCVLNQNEFNTIISGSGHESVIHSFGKPQKEYTHRNGTIQMYYYKKGMTIFVDRWGAIDKMEFYGKPRSDVLTASGRWANVYDEKGEWYEPNKWVIDRVGIRSHIKDVYKLWGKPNRRVQDAKGGEYLVYADRKIRLEIDRDYFVVNIEYDKDIE